MAYLEAINFTVLTSYLCANIAVIEYCCSKVQILIFLGCLIQIVFFIILFVGLRQENSALLLISLVTIFLRILILFAISSLYTIATVYSGRLKSYQNTLHLV